MIKLMVVLYRWLRRKPAPPPDQWAIARTEEDGRRVLYRFRSFMPPDIAAAEYPHLVNICWRYEAEASGGGMPGDPLCERMQDLESRLDPIEGKGTGFLVLAITGNNRKEWVWYVADTTAFMARVNEVLAAQPAFPVEFEAADDPEWSNFKALLATVKGIVH